METKEKHEEKCQEAFNQYIKCLSTHKSPESCVKKYYEKCLWKWKGSVLLTNYTKQNLDG